jgi:molybdopterin-guanine dinucleotide biosynthesis protein B
MENALIPILGFAAFSGTGKTTLLTKLIPLLKNTGLRIGVIKHCHHNFEIDKPGKDSYQLRKAGASPVMLVSSHRRAIITDFSHTKEPKLDDQLKQLDQSELDLILVEGFKSEHFPKIELHRPSLQHKLIFLQDPDIIAIATDDQLELTPSNTGLPATQISDLSLPPILNINQPILIKDFILKHFLASTHD